MAVRLVINSDGSQEYFDYTEEELLQQAIDLAASQTERQARLVETTRLDGIRTSKSFTDIAPKLKNATAEDITTWVNTNVKNVSDARVMFIKILVLLSGVLNTKDL